MKSKEEILRNHTESNILPTATWLHDAMEAYAQQFQQPVKDVSVLVEALKEIVYPNKNGQTLTPTGMIAIANNALRQYESTEPVDDYDDKWDYDIKTYRAEIEYLKAISEGHKEMARVRGDAINELQDENQHLRAQLEAKEKELAEAKASTH